MQWIVLLLPAAVLPGLFFVAMTPAASPRDAVMLEVERDGNLVQLQLIGESPVTQRVRYEMTFTGQSTSHHRGNAPLEAGQRQTLSTMTLPGGGRWCVRSEERRGGKKGVSKGLYRWSRY